MPGFRAFRAILGLTVLGAVASAGTALAAGPDPAYRLMKCSVIANDIERLACFDDTASAVRSERQAALEGWNINVRPRKDGKGKNVYLSVPSEEIWMPSVTRTGRVKNVKLRPILWMMCKNGKSSGYIDWGVFIDTDPTVPIRYAFDGGKKQNAEIRIAPDYRRTGEWASAGLVDFMKEMMNHKELQVEITPYQEKPIVATFWITGFKESARELRKQCGW